MFYERQEPVPLHLMVGYIPALHQRERGKQVCATCVEAWPCEGAQMQMDDAKRFTHPVWFDDAIFHQMAAKLAADEALEKARRAEKKAAAAAAAKELEALNAEAEVVSAT